jgi:cell division protein FtsB
MMVQYYHMFDFHEKRKIRQLVYSKVSIVVIFLLGVLISHSAFERYSVEREMATKRDEKSNELKALQERASVLESKISHLENDRGIEEELRSRFDVVKEGEQVVIILDKEQVDTSKLNELSQPPRDASETEGGMWQGFIETLTFWH